MRCKAKLLSTFKLNGTAGTMANQQSTMVSGSYIALIAHETLLKLNVH